MWQTTRSWRKQIQHYQNPDDQRTDSKERDRPHGKVTWVVTKRFDPKFFTRMSPNHHIYQNGSEKLGPNRHLFLQDQEVIDRECGIDDPNPEHPLANELEKDNMETIHQVFSISIAKISIHNIGPQSEQRQLGVGFHHQVHESNGNGLHPGMPNSMASNLGVVECDIIQAYDELVESHTSCVVATQHCNANGSMCSSTHNQTLDMNLEHLSETTRYQDMTLQIQNHRAICVVKDVDDLLCNPNIFCDIPAFDNEANPCKNKDRVSKVKELNSWESLQDDLQGLVLKKLMYEDLFQAKLVSRGMKKFIESPTFLSSRGGPYKEGLLACLHFYVKDEALQWSGFDLDLKEWRPLPTLRCLPPPNLDLFKDYLVSASGGLLCANVSKSLQNEEELVVCNPLTQTSRILPPLNFRRNPVLMHLLTDPKKNSYKVIVVGSSGMMATKEHNVDLSRKTEVFDSLTSQWEVTGDMAGLEFGLNEYQTGVCINGILYCISFLEDGSGKGVLAYDVPSGDWLSIGVAHCPLQEMPTHNWWSVMVRSTFSQSNR